MANARMREQWNHTSVMLAMTASINRDVKRRPEPFTAAEFNPYESRRKTMPIPADITVLRDVFVRPTPGGGS
jgi:hypothetical protein